MANEWGGTNISAGIVVLACTSAPTATTAPAASVAPWRIVAPVPTYTHRSSTQPSSVACGPTNTWSPSTTGRSASPAAVARSTACSLMTHASPTVMYDASASSTAPYIMRARGPTRISPTRVAVGATYAVLSTAGVQPRCLISMPRILSAPRPTPTRQGAFRPQWGHARATVEL